MAIPQDQTIDLNNDQFYAFLFGPTTVYNEPDPPTPAGFHKDSDKTMGSSAMPVPFRWIVRETWKVISRQGQYISSLEAIVPTTQDITITTVSVLFIRNDTTPDNARIIHERLQNYNYDPRSPVDPNDWARDAMPPDLKGGFSTFDVRQRARVDKLGQPRQDTSARDAVFDYFRHQYGEAYTLKGPVTEVLRELPESPKDVHIREVKDVTSEPEARTNIDDIARGLKPDCEGLESWQQRIADLFSYPEFMVRWELVDITIGCFRVKLNLPVLYTRTATQQLWVFGRWPKDPTRVLGDVVKMCALQAAAAGVIVGIALVNFVAALKAFEVVFEACITQKVGHTVECVIPGLAIMVKRNDWTRV